MVDIEVDDGDAFKAAAAVGVAGGDRHVVEDAEPHRLTIGGMVAGRSHETERALDLAVEDGLRGGEATAGGAEGGVVGAGGDEGVGVGPGAALRRHLADAADVRRLMHQRHLIEGGVAGGQRDEARGEAGFGEDVHDGSEAEGAFGVRARVVPEVERVVDQADLLQEQAPIPEEASRLLRAQAVR